MLDLARFGNETADVALTARLAKLAKERRFPNRVRFDLVGADGAVRVPAQDVELSREYTYDSVASAGSPAEQTLIQDELRREMQAAILRRLDAVLRAD